MSKIKKYYNRYLKIKAVALKVYKHLIIFKRSVLFQIGITSNKRYYNPKLKHPMVMPLFLGCIPMPIFGVNLLRLIIGHYSIVIYYYTRYMLFKDIIKFLYALLELGFALTFGMLLAYFGFYMARIWYMFEILFEKVFNITTGKSDGIILSWFQGFIFYRYFENVRYFFYLKIYGPDFLVFCAEFMAFIHEDFVAEPEFGPDTRYFGWSTHPGTKRESLHSKVLISKEFLYPSKIRYYHLVRIFYKKHKFFGKQNFVKYIKKKCGF